MADNQHIDLADAFKKMLAENRSQEARLQEYGRIISSRDAEIDVLQTMLSEANAHRSSMDNQLFELSDLRQYIKDLQQQVAGAVYMSTGKQQRVSDTVSMELQLRELNTEYTFLQSQLTDLQTQLQEANNRNLLLQQQVSRVSELESLLEKATEELRRLNQQLPGRDTPIFKDF